MDQDEINAEEAAALAAGMAAEDAADAADALVDGGAVLSSPPAAVRPACFDSGGASADEIAAWEAAQPK